MNRIYKNLCAAILGVLLAVFVISLFDGNAGSPEAEPPNLTVSSVLDGSWWEELQMYFADTFPGREALLDDFSELEKFYHFAEAESDE